MYALTYGACGVWAGIVQAVAARRKGHGLTSSILVVLVFLTVGSFSAVIGSAVIGTYSLRSSSFLISHHIH
jgi:hypothetical protein